MQALLFYNHSISNRFIFKLTAASFPDYNISPIYIPIDPKYLKTLSTQTYTYKIKAYRISKATTKLHFLTQIWTHRKSICTI